VTGEAWLRRFCDATTAPPATDDIDELLAAWTVVEAARQALLDGPDRPQALASELAPLVAEIAIREDVWRCALAAGLSRIGAQRMHATQIRRYQRSSGPAEL
jgi:hypothetical protein